MPLETQQLFPLCEFGLTSEEGPISAPHIGVLPNAGTPFEIVLFENVSLPNDEIYYPETDVTCVLRLETCANCMLTLDYEAPSSHLTDLEIEQV